MDMATPAELREERKVDEIAAWIHAQPYDRFHMIVECVDRRMLVDLLRANVGSPKRVKAALREQARLWTEQARNCAFE